MPSCYDCGKILASPAGLRRHVNSQHEQSEWHFCECGKRFLDPAARSRCRAGHSRSFGCSAWGCDYRSCRKDSVKQHIRRRHAGFPELQVLTFPLSLGDSGWPSNSGLAAEFAPAPSELISFPHAIRQPQVDTPIAYFPPSPPYNPEASPEYWPHFASGITRSAYVPPL